MATQVNIHEAKTHFSKLVDRVTAGEDIVVAKAGRPVMRLVPIAKRAKRRLPGTAKGKVWMSEDFNAPLPAKFMKHFR